MCVFVWVCVCVFNFFGSYRYLGGEAVQQWEHLEVGLQLVFEVVVGIPVLQLAGQRQALIPVALNLQSSEIYFNP